MGVRPLWELADAQGCIEGGGVDGGLDEGGEGGELGLGVEGRAVEDVFEGVHYVQGVFIDDGDGDLALLGLGEEVRDGFEVAGEDDASGGGVDGAPVEVGAVAAADDGLVGALGVVLGAGGEVLGVEDVGADHDVLYEGVAAFELEGVAGIEAGDEVVDGDAV